MSLRMNSYGILVVFYHTSVTNFLNFTFSSFPVSSQVQSPTFWLHSTVNRSLCDLCPFTRSLDCTSKVLDLPDFTSWRRGVLPAFHYIWKDEHVWRTQEFCCGLQRKLTSDCNKFENDASRAFGITRIPCPMNIITNLLRWKPFSDTSRTVFCVLNISYCKSFKGFPPWTPPGALR